MTRNLYRFIHPLQLEMEACPKCRDAAQLWDDNLNVVAPQSCPLHNLTVCLICNAVWNAVTDGDDCPNEGNDFHKGYRKCQEEYKAKLDKELFNPISYL